MLVSSEQTHFYFCISFTSFSACLHRESSKTLTLAPKEGEVTLLPPLPLFDLSPPSPLTSFFQRLLFVQLQIWQMTVFSSVFELDCHTVPIHSHMHVSIVLGECVCECGGKEKAATPHLGIAAPTAPLATADWAYKLNVTGIMGWRCRGGGVKWF